MKNLIFSIITWTLLLSSLFSEAQDPKWKNFYKVPNPIKESNYTVDFSDIVSKMDYCKMAIRISNPSDDYLMYKKAETSFLFAFGTFQAETQIVFILPGDSKKKTIKADGDSQFLIDNFKIKMDGFYKIPKTGTIVDAENFQLPASKNKIIAGNFTIRLLKLKKETKETYAKFECVYQGDKVAIVDPTQLSVTIDGKDMEFANDNKKESVQLMTKGDAVKFNAIFHIPGRTSDMQFATLYINWNNTFMESNPEPLKAVEIDFSIDPGMTAAKNK